MADCEALYSLPFLWRCCSKGLTLSSLIFPSSTLILIICSSSLKRWPVASICKDAGLHISGLLYSVFGTLSLCTCGGNKRCSWKCACRRDVRAIQAGQRELLASVMPNSLHCRRAPSAI